MPAAMLASIIGKPGRSGGGVDCRKAARYCLAMRVPILCLCALLALTAGAAGSSQTEDLDIVTSKGPQHFSVELATTDAERELGLMYRQNLAADAGMLFVYPGEQEVAFWMKNTLIPLDMLFIGADGRIRHIEERTIPLNETPISSIYPVKAVLEVNGGTVERLGIQAGDLVRNAALGTGG